jgi:hypothetical protein
MANNQFQTTQYVLDEVMVRYVNYLLFAKVANRNFETDYKNLKYATGATIDYRLEERYRGGEGATATSEARVQQIRPLTISKQFHTMVDFSGFQLTFDRARDEPYLDQMLNPRVKRLANQAEEFIVDQFKDQIYFASGTPGVPIDFLTVGRTRALMTNLAIPNDGNRYFALNPDIAAIVANDLKGSFNMTINRGALLDGFVGHLQSFDMFESVFLGRHISGAGGNIVSPPTGFKDGGQVSNGPITGGNTIQVANVQNNTLVFRKGDSIELSTDAGVYFVNPENYQAITSRTAQFVVTEDVTSVGTNATIPVSPTIVISGARQNISGVIPNGAQIWLADDHDQSLAFHNQAIVYAAPPITQLKGGVEVATSYSDLYKMSITYSLGADVRNYLQFDRLDTLGGVAINPEFAVLVRS